MKKIVYVISFICSHYLYGQNALSFSNDQYSGINGTVLSPTTPYFNPNKWDVNIISSDVLFRNDYAYISDQTFFGLLHGNTKNAQPRKGITGKTQSNILDYSTKNFISYNLENDIMGPSFSMKQKINNQTFRLGLFSRLRQQGSVKNIDNYMKFHNDRVLLPSDYSFNSAKTNFMNWNEIGLNISTNLYTTNTEELIIGANIKYLIGLDGAVINSKSPIKLEANYIEVDSIHKKSEIYASNYNIEASYATNYDFDRDKYVYRNRGNGVGIDLGISLVDRRINDELYDFKLSANLLDIGYVNFRGEKHVFYNPGQRVKIKNNPNFDDVEFESIEQYLKVISKEVYGDENKSKVGNGFTIGLPTSLHVSMSKMIRPNQYWNVNWIQRTPIFENSLKRTNVLQTSYSIQNNAIGFGPSLSLYNYEKVTVGSYLRLGPLVMGSDNILPLFIKHNKLNASSIYFALKFYPFWDNEEKRRSREDCDCW
ncbi:hypothetical protein [Chishuiella sp.]|uniref:hypothetical protein n=1 Tax=Chishuiella sp. TaxID=1969467 RepID=UPI0028A8ECF0|nr:hypothetical protein [Chishuiella sp.]